jgi:fructose-1,6-bisphosphatase
MQIPEVGKIYSMNEGNYAMWDEETKAYTDSLKDPAKWGGKPYSARYIGSLVSGAAQLVPYCMEAFLQCSLWMIQPRSCLSA